MLVEGKQATVIFVRCLWLCICAVAVIVSFRPSALRDLELPGHTEHPPGIIVTMRNLELLEMTPLY